MLLLGWRIVANDVHDATDPSSVVYNYPFKIKLPSPSPARVMAIIAAIYPSPHYPR